MAETAVLQAPLTEQTVKTLDDREKEGGMHVDVNAATVQLACVKGLPDLSKDGEEKENKQINKDPDEGEEKGEKDCMQVDTSPCSSAEVSLTESPCFNGKKRQSKHSSDSACATPRSKDGDDSLGCQNGSKRRRRNNRHKGGKNHRKQWKPYSKLSWDEKKKRDDKESIRATKKRDDRFACGLPMAPYNTTQFLMEDQDRPSPQATPANGQPHHTASPDPDHEKDRMSSKDDAASGSYSSTDGEYYDSPDDEDIFMEKEFSEAYDNFHAERLQQLTKEELVKEYLELETKNEQLEKKMKGKKSTDKRSSSEEGSSVGDASKLEEEMKKMREENAKLSRENAFLKVAAGKL